MSWLHRKSRAAVNLAAALVGGLKAEGGLIADLASAPAGPVLVGTWCPRCRLRGGPWPRQKEAELLAGVHDQLHHGQVRTARVVAWGAA